MTSIDPATQSIAYAQWSFHRSLIGGGIERFETYRELWGRLQSSFHTTELSIEGQQVYQGAKNTKGADAADLLALARTVGACAAYFDRTTIYLPNQWKGQVPKNIMQKRIDDKLNEGEKAVVKRVMQFYPKSVQHNIWDAIGIGLYHLGRL